MLREFGNEEYLSCHEIHARNRNILLERFNKDLSITRNYRVRTKYAGLIRSGASIGFPEEKGVAEKRLKIQNVL